jgi:polyisoprenoid-binding protein YceI
MFQAMGHDLKIRVTAFTIDIDEATGQITARFDPQSLRVECAVRNGVDRNDLLSEKDKEEINDHIIRDVLEARRYTDISFTSRSVAQDDDTVRLTGDVLLHGRKKEITVISRTVGAQRIAEATVSQPDFGIRPFSAFFGMLKIRPSVLIHVIIASKEHLT